MNDNLNNSVRLKGEAVCCQQLYSCISLPTVAVHKLKRKNTDEWITHPLPNTLSMLSSLQGVVKENHFCLLSQNTSGETQPGWNLVFSCAAVVYYFNMQCHSFKCWELHNLTTTLLFDKPLKGFDYTEQKQEPINHQLSAESLFVHATPFNTKS